MWLLNKEQPMKSAEKLFFTSDQHYGHETAAAANPSKSWGTNTRHQFESVEAMNRAMIRLWNLEVPDDGEVYMLGDFVYNGSSSDKAPWMLREAEAVLGQLKGTKHLIVGNHDLAFKDETMVEAYKKCGFETVTRGSVELEIGGVAFELSHFPRWELDAPCPEHYPAPIEDWDGSRWLLHGHVHGRTQMKADQKAIDVGVDAWSFRPVAAATILSMIMPYEGQSAADFRRPMAPNTFTVR